MGHFPRWLFCSKLFAFVSWHEKVLTSLSHLVDKGFMSCDHNTGTGNGLPLGFGDGHRGEKSLLRLPGRIIYHGDSFVKTENSLAFSFLPCYNHLKAESSHIYSSQAWCWDTFGGLKVCAYLMKSRGLAFIFQFLQLKQDSSAG